MRDLVGVSVVGAGVIGLVVLIGQSGVLPTDDLQDLLVLGTVGLGTAAALLGDVAGRLTGEVRPGWIAAAVALYTLVVVPSGTLWPEIAEQEPAVALGMRSAAFAVLVVLAAVAIRPPVDLAAPWLGAGVGVLLVIAVGEAAVLFPLPGTALAGAGVLTGALAVAWVLASCWLVAQGVLTRDPVVWWMALGMVLVGAAHLHRLVTGAEFEHPDTGFGAVRLVGVLVMLIGMLRLVRGGLLAVRAENWELEEELRIAATHLRRARHTAAERDHELRNGLAGLAGITRLLSGGNGNPEHEQLRTAVLHELSRLAAMVEDDQAEVPGPASFDVTVALSEAVTLRHAEGADIALESPPGLRATGRPEVLAQVMGNLLGNCARHAPGAPVRVLAVAAGPHVVIEVADDGPGIAPGLEGAVLRRGVHDLRRAGHGLGLYVSRDLVAGAGGDLRVLPNTEGRGCTVVVELPRSATNPQPAAAVGAVATSTEAVGR